MEGVGEGFPVGEKVENKALTERNRLKDELVQEFYASDRYQGVKTYIHNRIENHGKDALEAPDVFGSVSGFVFEEIALNYYYTRLTHNPENRALADFLQRVLMSNKYRDIDFFSQSEMNLEGDPLPVPDENGEYGENMDNLTYSLNLFPGTRPVENPDALLIDIKTDSVSGKRVAKIVGALDAKVKGGIGEKQFEGFKRNLWKLVNGMKPQYRGIIQGLDLEAELPEQVDIVSMNDIGVKSMRPQESPEKAYAKYLGELKKIYIPITREEVQGIVRAMISDELRSRDEGPR